MRTLSAEELFEFGTVVGVHGLRGDLKVRSLTPESDSLLHASSVVLRDKDGADRTCRPLKVSAHKANILLRVEGVDSVEAASELVGRTVLMPLAELPELPEGEHYWHQLEGMTVVDKRCGEIGQIEAMFTTAAHDIYEVQGRFGEVLIPVVDAFILDVDMETRRIQVDLPEGLIPESDED